jgi:hypothetical protein
VAGSALSGGRTSGSTSFQEIYRGPIRAGDLLLMGGGTGVVMRMLSTSGGEWCMANIAKPPCDEVVILAGPCERPAIDDSTPIRRGFGQNHHQH